MFNNRAFFAMFLALNTVLYFYFWSTKCEGKDFSKDIGYAFMPVSPIEFRYGREEVKNIFSEESRFRYLLRVERAIAQAESEFKVIPREAYESIATVIDSGNVSLNRMKEIESETRHDIAALVKAISEQCPENGDYVHFGATSNDIDDSATALQIKDFLSYLEDDLLRFQETLASLVLRYKNTPMLGRTHGQHASPITFGLKLSVYLTEMNRNVERLLQSYKRIIAGKLSGPVGTGASLGPDFLKIQERAMEILGISADVPANQVVDRDRYIEFLSLINLIATLLEKIGTEIRNLQRPEIGEVSEYFDTSRQIGSSSMPSKVNPINSENVVSLARFIRSLIISEYEAAVTWHERDLTNSASERFVIPYACILTDHILTKMTSVLETLKVDDKRMLDNLLSDDFTLSEEYVTVLTSLGVPRQTAHELVRSSAMYANARGISLTQAILKNRDVPRDVIARLPKIDDPTKFVGHSRELCDLALKDWIKTKSTLMEGKKGGKIQR